MMANRTTELAALACVVVLVLCLPCIEAAAQEDKLKTPKGMKKKSDQSKDLKELHVKAVARFKAGKIEEAVEFFLQAEEIESSPVTIFNIGKCYDKLGKYNEAHDYYSRYMATGEEVKLEEAKEAIARIEQLPITLEIITYPPDAKITLDGRAIKADKTPVTLGVDKGGHEIEVGKKGYKTALREVDMPYGGSEVIDVKLEAATKKSWKGGIPISVSLAVGATASTSKTVASYIDAGIGVFYRIKQFSVGLGIDNKFFSDSYMLTLYPAGTYTLKVWKDLSLNFAVGMGLVYFYSSEQVEDSSGNIVVRDGNMYDFAIHLDAKLLYELGPVYLQFVPASIDIVTGAGSIEAAPLAQFLFLVGVVYDF